jgi:hypothetical protein
VTAPRPQPFSRVRLLAAVADDLKQIRDRFPPVVTEAFRALKRLDDGSLQPTPLRDFAKTGDLTDYGKVVVETPGAPKHRIVVRSRQGGYEIIEAVAIEAHTEDLLDESRDRR